MSEPTFREKYAEVQRLHADDLMHPDEIERLYDEAHPKPVTAEDVIFDARWDMGKFTSNLACGASKKTCRDANDYRYSSDLPAEEWHATLLHVAQQVAALRNAARADEAWIEEAVNEYWDGLMTRAGGTKDGLREIIRAAYRSRSKA